MSFSAESSWYQEIVQATIDEVMHAPSGSSGGRPCVCTRCIIEQTIRVAAPKITEGVLQGLAEIRRDS